MAIQKIEIRPKGTGDYADVLYPRTSVDMVDDAPPRTATLVVAASNSSVAGKSSADYVCDGVSDNVEINAAITALGVTGGKVVLLEGLFAIATAILLASNVSLEGQGNGTVLRIPNATNTTFNVIQNSDTINGNTSITVSNLKIDGNKASNTAGTQHGISLTKVTYSTIQNVTAQTMRGTSIVLTSSSYNTIAVNTCRLNGSNGITLQTTSNTNTVTGNICQGNSNNGIDLSPSSSNNTITGNACQGNANSGIYLNTASYNTITGNTCQGTGVGIYLSASNNNTITGNTCQGNAFNAIDLSSSSNNTIIGNTCVENSQQTHNLYDNILLESSSNTNNVQGNTCRQGALANKPRYGIRVNTANCTGNLVTNNDLTTGGATGAFSDLGTGTITTAGNKLA